MPKSFLNTPGLPRGLRNNNPGNLRPGDDWQGMVGTSGGFIVFQDIYYGIRAMATDVGNDIRIDGKNTIRKLVTEYAPPSENDTAAYIDAMVRSTGFAADQALPGTRDALTKLLRGFMDRELGREYSSLITDADIAKGVSMVNPSLLEFFRIHQVATIGIGTVVLIGVVGWLFFSSSKK